MSPVRTRSPAPDELHKNGPDEMYRGSDRQALSRDSYGHNEVSALQLIPLVSRWITPFFEQSNGT
jgi:hypothetical protein